MSCASRQAAQARRLVLVNEGAAAWLGRSLPQPAGKPAPNLEDSSAAGQAAAGKEATRGLAKGLAAKVKRRGKGRQPALVGSMQLRGEASRLVLPAAAEAARDFLRLFHPSGEDLLLCSAANPGATSAMRPPQGSEVHGDVGAESAARAVAGFEALLREALREVGAPFADDAARAARSSCRDRARVCSKSVARVWARANCASRVARLAR